jgi:glucose/mannose transport system substrate-binding protein
LRQFISAGLKDNGDFGWVSHPGSISSFMIVADGFVATARPDQKTP